MEEYFQNCCSELKKGKLKTKKLLKITIIDEQEPSVQLADKIKEVQVWNSGNMSSLKAGPIVATK